MDLAAALLQADRGETKNALERLTRLGESDQGASENRYVAKLAHVNRAGILASLGRVTEAEDALARAGEAPGMGWRRWSFALVPGLLAAVGGDAGGVLEASDRALALVAPGAYLDRWRAAVALAPALVAVGLVARAQELLDGALADCEERLPGEAGDSPAHGFSPFAPRHARARAPTRKPTPTWRAPSRRPAPRAPPFFVSNGPGSARSSGEHSTTGDSTPARSSGRSCSRGRTSAPWSS